jgi:hypothetical protein
VSDRTPAESARSRRNVAIGLALAAFVALIFIVTMVRLAQNVENGAARPAIIEPADG